MSLFQENEGQNKPAAYEILPYTFHLQYARENDSVWQNWISNVKILFAQLMALMKIKLVIPIRALPRETLLEITSYMDATSLCRASSVCASWIPICSRDTVWENLCRKKFSLSMSYFNASSSFFNEEKISLDSNAKHLYKMASTSLTSILRGKCESDISSFSRIPIHMHFPLLAR
jgi:hypothetical protein